MERASGDFVEVIRLVGMAVRGRDLAMKYSGGTSAKFRRDAGVRSAEANNLMAKVMGGGVGMPAALGHREAAAHHREG